PVLGPKGGIVRVLLLVPGLATRAIAFIHETVFGTERAIGAHARIDVVPCRFDGPELGCGGWFHPAVIPLPIENRRMAAVTDDHVPMQLLLQLHIVGGWIGS